MSPAGRGGPRAKLAALSVGALLAVTIGVLLALAGAGIGLALFASFRLNHQRSLLVNAVTPANRAALELEDAYVNEETGIRGYLITAGSEFLQPYGKGLRAEARAYTTLESHAGRIGAPLASEIQAVRAAAQDWKRGFVSRALIEPRKVVAARGAADAGGKKLFDALRGKLEALQRTLTHKNAAARNKLSSAARLLEAMLILAAVLVFGSLLGAALVLRRTVTRPLALLGAAARGVAGEELHTRLQIPLGPLEVRELSGEIEAMRERIVHELAVVEAGHERLERQALELSRSNADLEQFAYVASHDLQEPLRKVASFTQALKTRYHGQLDERADQYIDFAVDGAKRMQVLINDLLDFSRVGRGGRLHEPVELELALAEAKVALAAALEASGGQVLGDQLPTVTGDRQLLASLLQNLVANALKFSAAEPPVVRLSAEPGENGFWVISCADNGIGVEPDYAERIFLIFQRLHARDVYDGSGIGLALCRKIVEYHGGRIWLDTHYSSGARFQFTLPRREEQQR